MILQPDTWLWLLGAFAAMTIVVALVLGYRQTARDWHGHNRAGPLVFIKIARRF